MVRVGREAREGSGVPTRLCVLHGREAQLPHFEGPKRDEGGFVTPVQAFVILFA